MTRTFTDNEIDGLIAKLEAATGPSKERDRQIALLIGWHRVEPRHARNKHGAWISPADFIGVTSGGAPILDSLHGTDMHRDVPDFTASIDAALTLVPEGHDWALHVDNGAAIAGCMPASEDGCDHSDSHGATPAIALSIAALKARASIRESGPRPAGDSGVHKPPSPTSGTAGRGDTP